MADSADSNTVCVNGIASQSVVVILAAGKGTRMGRADLAKVCFEIDGVAAINRTIGTFRKLGFESFLLVVGSNCEQVMQTVGAEHPGVSYVYQSPQLGTGHAARMAADTLRSLGHRGNVLVTMGDKFIEPQAIEALRDGFVRQSPDLSLVSIPRTKDTEGSGGRIFIDSDGQVSDIIEAPDIARQAIGDELKKKLKTASKISSKSLLKLIAKHIPNEKKQLIAVPKLAELAREGKDMPRKKLLDIIGSQKYLIKIAGKPYTAEQIEKICKSVNPSLYLFKAEAFYKGVGMLTNDNAQGEYYLTDVVRHLSSAASCEGENYKVRVVQVDNPDLIQGFNSPDELLRIQDYIRTQKKSSQTAIAAKSKTSLSPRQYCTVGKWIDKIKAAKPAYSCWQSDTYGNHPDLHESKTADYINLLECYGRRFGFDQKVCIVRAPGRVNLMGRHVDHRGGYNNFLAIHRETIAVVGRRDDDRVVAVNARPDEFAPVEFSMSELIGTFGWTDWLNFVNSDWVRSMLRSNVGDWGNYIKAAMLRLQHHYQDLKIDGMNMAVYGDIPIAAGLSSSSSIVVATLEGAIALNNLELSAGQFVDLCGQGEWFVGSRGGSGDHAAIYLGKRGKITQVGYLPFRIENVIDAPRDCQVIIADSHIKAAKSGHARDQFNSKITAYNLGLALLRQRCPQYADVLEYVRDINPQTLGCMPSEVYEMLECVPQSMTRKELQAALWPQSRELIESNFATHQDPGSYDLRGVLLFGAAEAARSAVCAELIESGRLYDFGMLMKVSHDGDRVSSAGDEGRYLPLKDPCTDGYLNMLKSDLVSQCPQRVLAGQLYMQPGYYACSTPQIDKMVDLAGAVPGVIGAQIAGAGLGGCIMILAKKDAVQEVRKKLTKYYYKPQKLKPAIIPCTTTQGASVAEF
jgi:N-acetylgalactosamine kinase